MMMSPWSVLGLIVLLALAVAAMCWMNDLPCVPSRSADISNVVIIDGSPSGKDAGHGTSR